VEAAAPQVLVGPIDVRSNVLKTHFMDKLDPSLLDFVAMDAYDGINGGRPDKEFGVLVGKQVTFLKTIFPGNPPQPPPA
jgi:hypothetical protein